MGKISYAVSSIVCVPNSLAYNGPALGAQAGEQKIKDLVYEAGFSRFRRTTQTPLNVVYEARPGCLSLFLVECKSVKKRL